MAATISGSGAVGVQVYWWHDKYRPRKPKYFNRVHTGYEWNKYNQTHYDHDNPPPKVCYAVALDSVTPSGMFQRSGMMQRQNAGARTMLAWHVLTSTSVERNSH